MNRSERVEQKPLEAGSFFLLCLTPPGSVEKEVAALQQTLYARLGLVSGLCLPPLIPLRFLSSEAEISPGRELGELLSAGLRLRTRGYGEAEGCLFWDLDAPRAFTAWRRTLLRSLFPPGTRPASGGPALFPSHAGFFLARRCEQDGRSGTGGRNTGSGRSEHGGRSERSESAARPRESPELLQPPPELTFPAAALVLIEIRLLAESRRWWEGLVWEEKKRLPLKKPSPGP
jgi:hypothetical protein